MTNSHPLIGQHINKADTPALWVDLDALDNNVAKMYEMTKSHWIRWRPHVKASKSPDLAKRLLEGGAQGITCAKVSEAEAMVAGGIVDILIANEVVGQTKISRLVEVAKEARVCVACDDAENIQAISLAASTASQTIDILIDINVGANRCGVSPDKAPALAELVTDLPGVRLRGLMGYEGHVMGMQPEDKEAASSQAADILAEAKKALESAGFHVEILSGGGSGNYWHAASLGSINELQAGGGALMDISYQELMKLPDHQYALFLNAQVISTAVEGRVILDAGWKSTGRHTGLPRIVSHDDSEVISLNAEHTIATASDNSEISAGDRVTMVPHYSDSTVLLHREMYAVRNNIIEGVWPITGAGALH
jgi:D-serine deaminase-like pyridoxal phosphate-dependent protein